MAANPNAPPQLVPGDLLFYNTPGSFVDFVIRVKTWSRVAHIEVYVGDNQSVASRNFIGVNRYPVRTEGLVAVLRPTAPLDLVSGMEWFETVKGEKYDLSGLLCFTLASWQGSPDKMFCSEFGKLFYEHCKCPIIAREWEADRTAPADLMKGTVMRWLWVRPGTL